MSRGEESRWSRRLTFDRVSVASDLLALGVAYALALLLRFHPWLGPRLYGFLNALIGWRYGGDLSATTQRVVYVRDALKYLVPLSLALYGMYAMQGLYQSHRFLRRRPELGRIVKSNLVILGAVLGMLYVRRNLWHPRGFFVTVLFLNALLCPLFRMVMRQGVNRLRRTRGWWLTPTVLVGDTPEAEAIRAIIEEQHPLGMRVVMHLREPVDPEGANLSPVVTQSEASLVIVADDSLSVAEMMRILDLTARLDVAVKLLTQKLTVLHLEAGETFETIHGTPLVHFDEPSRSNKNAWWRVAISRTLAAGALLVLSPFMALIALAIKFTDPGPVLFVQDRFGVDRRPFKLYKFRTMRVDADAELAQLEAHNEAGTGLFKMRNDPRVTPIGRLLRRYSLDELPQILNVLRGDMRIVGPRPLPRRDLNNYYEDWHYHRHNGRPGLTCLWQVYGRSEIAFEDMCILDVYYLRNHNWPMDLRLVLKTVGVVVMGHGAY